MTPKSPADIASALEGFIARQTGASSVRVENLRRLTGGASRETWSFDAVMRGPHPPAPSPSSGEGEAQDRPLFRIVMREAERLNRLVTEFLDYAAPGAPKLGVVFAPATGRLHGGIVGSDAWLDEGSGRSRITTRQLGKDIAAVASRSHLTQSTIDYLDAAVGSCGYVSVGSSLKFGIVAEGKADIYPRLSPTSEWDTAAGHAILLAAGGRVDAPDGSPLAYGKSAFINRGFVATGGWEAPAIGPFMQPFGGGGELPDGV